MKLLPEVCQTTIDRRIEIWGWAYAQVKDKIIDQKSRHTELSILVNSYFNEDSKDDNGEYKWPILK